MSRKDHTNTNGLVAGRIPKNTPCPFEAECKLKMERCPTKDSLKQVDFSCAAARAHSIIKNSEEDEKVSI
jgi:hypothetical protein